MNNSRKSDQASLLQDQMASLNATPQSAQFLQAAEAFALDRSANAPAVVPTATLQAQVNRVLSAAESFIEDWAAHEGKNDPDCASAVAALEAVRPLLTQHAFMLHLLVRAGAEINGNPFLSEETILPEVRQFLRQPEIAPVLPEVVFDIQPDQVEIVDELLALDSDDEEETSGGCLIRAADSEKIVSVMMSDVIGDYDSPEQVPEWAWVEQNSTMSHRKNGMEGGIWEFVLNMSREFSDVPASLKPLLKEARSKGVAYLLFHQGT